MFGDDLMNERPKDAGQSAPGQMAPVYLVLERNSLIAEDIAGSLRAAGPCDVVHVQSSVEIANSLANHPRIEAAFLEMTYAQVVEAGLDKPLLSNGAQIVLTVGEDDEANVRSLGWNMLIRPFTDDMIRHAIRPAKPRGG
ncbi:hypothetical protein A8B76_14950 [Roseovarius indicus]|nr:hypothetical protein A8B76_14950 [Roseovarius indicus]